MTERGQRMTQEMIVRLAGPVSLLRAALTDGERERAAARLLVAGFGLLVAGFGVVAWLAG